MIVAFRDPAGKLLLEQGGEPVQLSGGAQSLQKPLSLKKDRIGPLMLVEEAGDAKTIRTQ
jgi:hypothetical protein